MVKSPPVHPSSSMGNESIENHKLINNTMAMKDDQYENGYHVTETYENLAGSPRSVESTEAEVCCGCRPKAKRKTRKFQKVQAPPTTSPTARKKKWWKKAVANVRQVNYWRYRDSTMGEDSEWKAFSQNRDARSIMSSEKGDDESMYFFDAVDRPLGDDEYPIDGYAIGAQKFKVVFTTSVQAPDRKVSLSDPDSMLRPRSRASSLGSNSSFQRPRSRSSSFGSLDSFEDAYELEPLETPKNPRDRIQNLKETSMRFRKIRRRTSEELAAELQKPSAEAIENAIGMAGYPGTLTVEQLEECKKFVNTLNEMPRSVSEQIYSYRDIEEQPYTICRWLRATKFDAAAILKRCEENQPLFDEAKEHNFYGPDLEEHLGCPFSVFLSQYPFLSIGWGKNGAPVNYFSVGKINPEGLMCLVTINQLKSYFWFSFMHSFKDRIRATQAENTEFCRCEGINVLDLSGLNASALTAETMEVIKISSKISDFFPETLHCMLVLNAPSFFTFSWKLIKNFIDPRTASRIQLFSSTEKGQKSLEKLIDKDTQIPSDYGGGNISLREAFLKECSDSRIVRQEIELLHCKRKGKKSLPNTWTLKADEKIDITVHTRSVSKATVKVILNRSVIKEAHAQCSLIQLESEDSITPHPRKTVVMSSLAGPGEVMVDVIDLDTPISKTHSGCSRGYFLVVGDVKKMGKSMRSNGFNAAPSSPEAQRRHVRFASNSTTSNRNRDGGHYISPYNTSKPPIGAKVTMTGLSFPDPIKVPPKHEQQRSSRKKKKLIKMVL